MTRFFNPGDFLRVVRVQWPVGQGCFATGSIETPGGTIHYVYDCGARNVSNLEPIIAAYARRVPHIDALFVSHLDGDHVDGLDTLLARLDVTTVYLPYLSLSQRLMTVAEAEAGDRRLTGSLIQAQFEPAAWFGSRGVQRVVFVRNGDEPGPSSEGPPEDPRPGPHDEKSSAWLLEKSRTRPLSVGGGGAAAVLEMEVDAHIAVVSGGYPINWILKPYVPRVSDDRVHQFEKKLLQVLDQLPGTPIDLASIKILLKTQEGRTKLRRCYEAILTDGSGKKHNMVSMSLYSGPAAKVGSWQIDTRFERLWGWRTTTTEAPGWIGTGDAKLNAKKRRAKWRSYYRDELGLTRTLLLPHHGSKANFHNELLRPPLHICIAAADERDDGYRHPSPEVVEAIDDAGLHLFHVTKRLESRFRETITEI